MSTSISISYPLQYPTVKWWGSSPTVKRFIQWE
jgi:hypothetical protein